MSRVVDIRAPLFDSELSEQLCLSDLGGAGVAGQIGLSGIGMAGRLA